MLGLWGNKSEGSAVSAEFSHALTRQVLRTELIRIKALIGTRRSRGSSFILHLLNPYAIHHLWHGRLKPPTFMRSWFRSSCSSSGFIAVISRHLRLDR